MRLDLVDDLGDTPLGCAVAFCVVALGVALAFAIVILALHVAGVDLRRALSS